MIPQAVLYAGASARTDAEQQLMQCDAYCRVQGYVVTSIHEDNDQDRRLAIQTAIPAACSRKGILVVQTLACLPGNSRDAHAVAAQLQVGGAYLAAVATDIDTRSLAGLVLPALASALAELDRPLPKEHNVDHDDSSRLIEDPAEGAVIALIRSKRDAGKGVREIARELEAVGVPCRGGRWYHSTVAKVL